MCIPIINATSKDRFITLANKTAMELYNRKLTDKEIEYAISLYQCEGFTSMFTLTQYAIMKGDK